MKRTLLACTALLTLPLGACSDFSGEPEVIGRQTARLVDVAPNRSLAVTETEIVSRFTLEDVLAQLIEQGGSTEQTPLSVFQQWAATNGECDDLNGFPLTCRQNDVDLEQDPFPPAKFAYHAVGLFNRFDLAPADGSDCGEYRIAFARSHSDFGQEKTLIFESRLPNPNPELGLEGCRPVAEFWANLSGEDSNLERGDQLLDFYFNGLPGFGPTLHVDHLSRSPGSGQVRTNSFLNAQEWSLREYGARTVCDPDCSLRFVQMPTAENPFLDLSADPTGDPDRGAFQDWLVDFVSTPGEGLLATSLGALRFPVPDEFNSAESLLPESRVFPLPIPNFGDNLSSELAQRIDDRLDAIGSDLTATQVVNRANSQTCNGCHASSVGDDLGYSDAFPDVNRFRHVRLAVDVDGPDGPRHRMSAALEDVFLPFRRDVLVDFLSSGPPNESSIQATLTFQSSWSEGYCADVLVENVGEVATNWLVRIELNQAPLTQSWNASFDTEGSAVTVTPAPWAPPLGGQASTSFGYCAQRTGTSSDPVIVSAEATE